MNFIRISFVLCFVTLFYNSARSASTDLISTFLSGGTNSLTEISLPTASPIDTLDGRGGVSFYGQYFDAYRSGGMEQSGASFTRTAGLSVWQSFHTPLPLSLKISRQNDYTRIDQSVSTEQVTYSSNYDIVSSELTVAPLRFVWLKAAISGVRVTPANLAFTTGFDYPKVASFVLQWSRENQISHAYTVWDGNPAEVWLRTRTEGMAGSFTSLRWHGFRLIADGTQRNWIRDTAYYNVPTFSPWGESVSYRAALEWQHQHFIYGLGTRGYRFNCMAYGAQDGITFSKLTALNFRQDGWFGSFTWREQGRKLIQSEFEYQHWAAYSRGHVEFWPFTPGWESLLGVRRYYITGADGNFWRVRVSTEQIPLDSKTTLSARCDYIDCILNGYLEHWRPAFLIFGIADLQYSVFDLQRVSGVLFDFRINRKISRFALEYEFLQTVPLRTQYRSEQTVTSTSPSTTSNAGPAYGGAIHTLTLSTFW